MTALSDTRRNHATREFAWRKMDYEVHTVGEILPLRELDGTQYFGVQLQDHCHSVVCAPLRTASGQLTIADIVNLSGDQYRFNFSAPLDGSVVVGDFLHVKGAADAGNNGRYEIIDKGTSFVVVENADGAAQAFPGSVACAVSHGQYVETSALPASGQCCPDYKGGSGRVLLNVDEDGNDFVFEYEGGGSINLNGLVLGSGGGGGGGGEENYILNGDFESNTDGWVSSGPNFTIARTTASGQILKGTASGKLTADGSQSVGDTVSYPFEISEGDTNRRLKSAFYFKGLTGYGSGECEVVLWDGVNEIVPSVSAIPGGAGYFEAMWISTSSTSYEIRFKATVTTAFELVVDVVLVNASRVVRGAAIGPWIFAGPVVITGSTTDPTFGTIAYSELWWRRVGQDAEVMVRFKQTSAGGSAGTGIYLIDMPSGLLIDTQRTKVDTGGSFSEGSGLKGSGTIGITTPTSLTANPFVYSSSKFGLWASYNASEAYWSASFGSSLNADLSVHVSFSVPIVGWESEVVLQESGALEFAYNSSTADSDDAVSFASGHVGGLVPTATVTRYKDIEFTNPVQPGELVQLWFKPKGRNWQESGSTYLHWHEYGSAVRGAYITPVAGSTTKYRVYFSGNGTGYSEEDASVNSWTAENGFGTRWLVVKAPGRVPIEIPTVIQTVHVRDEQTSGTNGGAVVGTGAWHTRSLNTLDNPSGFPWVSLSANQITLSAGRHEVDAFAQFYRVGSCRVRLWNVTDSAVALLGKTAYSGASSDIPYDGQVRGVLDLASEKTFELQYYVTVTTGSSDLGITSAIATEIYVDVKITKVG